MRLLTVGALAGAIVAIVGIIPFFADLLPDPDPVDRASISVDADAPVRLSEHKARIGGIGLDDRGGTDAVAGSDLALPRLRLVAIGATSEAPLDTTIEASEPVDDPAADDDGSEHPPAVVDTPEPAEQPTSPSGRPSIPPVIGTRPSHVAFELHRDVALASRVTDLVLKRSEWGPICAGTGCRRALIELTPQLDDVGDEEELSADALADRLVDPID